MRFYLAILLLPILVSSESLDFAAFGAKLGGRRNTTAIGIIMAEEANWLEMETQELLDQCNSQIFFSASIINPQFRGCKWIQAHFWGATANKGGRDGKPPDDVQRHRRSLLILSLLLLLMNTHQKLQVLPFLKANAPSTHALVLKRVEIVKKSIETSDRATKSFVAAVWVKN